MKASELITELSQAISEYGDLELNIRDCADGYDYDGCTVHGDPASEWEKQNDIKGTIDLNVWNSAY